MAKREFDYFKHFELIIEKGVEAANVLKYTTYHINEITQKMDEIHEIEHDADDLQRELSVAISKAFITPIEREDIKLIGQSLDNLVDSIDDVVVHFYLMNINIVSPYAIEFSELILKTSNVLRDLIHEFSNYKKSKRLSFLINDAFELEREADIVYRESIRHLYSKRVDPIDVIRWSHLYELLEATCDSCAEIAANVEIIILKNT